MRKKAEGGGKGRVDIRFQFCGLGQLWPGYCLAVMTWGQS